MNSSITLIVFIILLCLIIRQIKVWKWRCLISPGFYFGALWILGVLGSDVFSKVGFLPLTYPEYLDELNIYVGFTGFCFLLFTKRGRCLVNENGAIFNFIPNFTVFSLLSIVTLLVALITFVSSGASFDMGQNRSVVHDTVRNQSNIVGYFQILSTVLSICSGYVYGKFFIGKLNLSLLKKIILILPIMSGLVYSIYLGGRVNFIYAICDCVIGFSLAIPLMPSKKISRKIIATCLALGLLISFFISAVAAQRQETHGGSSHLFTEVTADNILLKVLYGPVEYMTSSYIGYQYRRDDFVDLNNLGYGSYTFNGFINWTLPFSSSLGLGDASIAKTCGIYHRAQESYDFERLFYYTTHSCYIPIVQDFGTIGAFPFIFLLVYISHRLFINIQRRKFIKHACSFFIFYLFLNYWLKSNYYGYLMNSVLIVLYGFLFIDIINYFLKKE